MSSESDFSPKIKCRRSPRLGFLNVDLRNITVRSRWKDTPSKKRYWKNSSDSEDMVFENPAESKGESPELTSDDSSSKIINISRPTSGLKSGRKSERISPKKTSVGEVTSDDSDSKAVNVGSSDDKTGRKSKSISCKTSVLESNSENGRQTNLDLIPHSTLNASKFSSKGDDGIKSRNASKCLFNKCSEKNEECNTRKKTFEVVADVHCDIVKKKNSSLQNNVRQSNRVSELSDIESSSCFQPPYSSTRVFKTPNCSRSPKQQNLQLSGVKELKSPHFNKPNDVVGCNPTEIKNVPSSIEILPAPISDDDSDDDIPCTQPATTILLRGVVAYVDVKIGNLIISDSLKQQLISLGAEVEDKFRKRVTHVIFKDGNLTTYKKAKRWKVPLVNVMWITDCATSLSLLPTSKYIPSGLSKYEERIASNLKKDLFDLNKKPKVFSSSKMKKMRQEIKKLETRNDYKRCDAPGFNSNAVPVTPEHEKPCRFNIIEEFINNLDGEVREMINRSESPLSSEDIHIPVPLSLLRMCITPRKAKTDVKELPAKMVNGLARTTNRRKNLDNLLMQNEGNQINGINYLNKENVDSSEDYSGERKSAPSELVTDYRYVTNRTKKRMNCNNDNGNNKPGKSINIINNNVVNNGNINCNDINSQKLTQTSRKRQLLPLDRPANDFISESLNNSYDVIPIINPYDSPKRKCRKVTGKKPSTLKKHPKVTTMRPVLQRIDEGDVVKNVKDNSDFFKRNSSVFFTNAKSALKTKRTVKPTIVCTGFTKDALDTVHAIVEKLGKYTIEDKVSDRTTHVIVKNDRFRTVNLLKGICRGCWIVSIEWVYSSCESEKWISEEQFELTSFSPAVRLNRYDRQAFGPEYTFELFSTCGPIFVNSKCSPPSEDVKELIRLSGGRIISVARAASILIGGRPSMISKTPRVYEKWVLDSITKGRLLDYSEYIIPSLRLS